MLAELAAVYAGYCTADTRIYREGAGPYRGRELIQNYWLFSTGSSIWQPAEVRISRSGDLGYVYGSVRFRPRGACGSIEACYLRVWKQLAGEWQLLIDGECPVAAS